MQSEKKKRYEKPLLIPIEIKAEEVLGIGCNKPSMGPSVGDIDPMTPCGSGTCAGVGTS